MANDTFKTAAAGAVDPLGADHDETRLAAGGTSSAGEVTDREVIPLVEETARIDKREVRGGAVRVRTAVDTVEEIARAELQGETAEVTRVPIDREIGEVPQIRTENGVTIIPVVEEVLVVEKRLVLKEELHVRRLATMETVEMPVALRKERASIEREPMASNTNEEIRDEF